MKDMYHRTDIPGDLRQATAKNARKSLPRLVFTPLITPVIFRNPPPVSGCGEQPVDRQHGNHTSL